MSQSHVSRKASRNQVCLYVSYHTISNQKLSNTKKTGNYNPYSRGNMIIRNYVRKGTDVGLGGKKENEACVTAIKNWLQELDNTADMAEQTAEQMTSQLQWFNVRNIKQKQSEEKWALEDNSIWVSIHNVVYGEERKGEVRKTQRKDGWKLGTPTGKHEHTDQWHLVNRLDKHIQNKPENQTQTQLQWKEGMLYEATQLIKTTETRKQQECIFKMSKTPKLSTNNVITYPLKYKLDTELSRKTKTICCYIWLTRKHKESAWGRKEMTPQGPLSRGRNTRHQKWKRDRLM